MGAASGTPYLIRKWPRMAIAVLLAFVVLAIACSSSGQGTIEERANALDRQLICPICPGETIDQAQVQLAKDMRKLLREKLAAGEDESEIKDFFVEKYGVSVLASPPASGFNLLIWLVPPVGLAGALVALYLILKEMRRRKSVPDLVGINATDDALAPYLEAVDLEMRRGAEERAAGPDRGDEAGSGEDSPDDETGSGAGR